MEFLRTSAFVYATGSNFFFHLTFTAFFLLPLYVRSLGGSEGEIGLIMGSFGFTAMLLIPLVGAMMDRYGRRRFLIFGCLLMLAASLAYAVVPFYHPLFFAALRALQGASFSCAFIAANTFIVDVAPANQRAKALGYFGVFTLVTHAIGPMLCEAIQLRAGFRIAFIIATVWSLAGWRLAVRLKESRIADPAPLRGPAAPPRRLPGPLAATLLAGGSFAAVVIFTPLFMAEAGLRPVSVFFGSYTLAAVGVRLLFGGLSDRVGREPTVLLSLALFCGSILGLALLARSGHPAWAPLVAVAVTFGASHGMLYPTMSAQIVDMMPEAQKGRAVGYYSGAFNVGATLAAFAFGPLLEAKGFAVLFASVAGCAALGLAVFAATGRPRSG